MSGGSGAPDPLNLFDSENPALGSALPDPLGIMDGSKENKAKVPTPATTTTSPNYTPEERAGRAFLINRATQISNQQQGQYSKILQPSANTIAGQQKVLDASAGSGQNLVNNATAANNFGLSSAVLDPNNTPGYDAALQAAIRPVTQAYTDPGGVLSKIRSNFTTSAPGGQSSREAIAQGLAGRSYLNTIGDISGQMSLGQYNKGLDFMKSAMATAPLTYTLGLQPGVTQAGIGAQQESYDKAQFMAPWSELQPFTNMLSAFQGGAGSTTTSTPAMGPDNSAMQALGIAAMIASFFSDRRLKSNIKRVGTDPRGFGIYEYDLFGCRQRGVMADEIEKVMPAAVTIDSGFKRVNYGLLFQGGV